MDSDKEDATPRLDQLAVRDEPAGTMEEPKGRTDMESGGKKLPYPKSVFFIVIMEFCERFSYYGMRAVLTLYLRNVLNFSDDSATTIYHLFTAFCYFTPLLGAMIADSLLGKFKTIFYLSVVYAIGNVVLSMAATPPLNFPATAISMIGLALIAIGTGGIKPCVSAFGGDQFKLPEQETPLKQFFSIFYFSINAGSLISTFLTPIFRNDISCFDERTCYSLAFSVPAALMIVALIVFLIGRPLYIVKKPAGNVVVKVAKCIGHAMSRKRKSKEKKEHFLDHADDEYDRRFIEDVKIVLRVLVLYIPLPFFWSLFDQQGSRWTIQAINMDGKTFGYTFKPDQVQVINPLLILIFIPIFEKGIYPLLGKCNILKKPLQRLTIGGILAGISFIISGILELQLEPTYATVLESTETNFHFVNNLPCLTKVQYKYDNQDFNLEIKEFESIMVERAKYIEKDYNYPLTISTTGNHDECVDGTYSTTIKGFKENATTIVIGKSWNTTQLYSVYQYKLSDEMERSSEGFPKIRVYRDKNAFEGFKNPIFRIDADKADDSEEVEFGSEEEEHYATEVQPKEFDFIMEYGVNDKIEKKTLKSEELRLGGSYVAVVSRTNADVDENATFNFHIYEITKPNSIHMMWLIPQYIVITLGEIMFSITGLEFSYSQSPVSMKSVMQSAWLLTVAFGNIIDIIIVEAKFFKEQSKEFFLFAGLMFVDMIVFSWLAYRYVPAVLETPEEAKKREGEENDGLEKDE